MHDLRDIGKVCLVRGALSWYFLLQKEKKKSVGEEIATLVEQLRRLNCEDPFHHLHRKP